MGNPLATNDQKCFDRLVGQLSEQDEYQSLNSYIRSQLQEHFLATLPDAQKTLAQVASELSINALALELNNKPDDPAVAAYFAPEHNWFGYAVPAARTCIINPDNHLRWMPVNSQFNYRLIGKLCQPQPAEITFSACDYIVSGDTRQHIPGTQSCLSGTDLVTDDAGDFDIYVGVENPLNAANFLQLEPETTHVTLRDTLGDWANENPCSVQIECLGLAECADKQSAPPTALPSGEQRNDILLREIDLITLMHYQSAPNQPPKPRTTFLVTQLLSMGNYKLAEDEVLLITINPLDAQYFSAQAADPWSWGEYQNHTGSLNHTQAQKDADGRYRFVLSPKDEGVHNWLDTQGLHQGTLAFRWQRMSDVAAEVPDDILQVQCIKRENLDELLPTDTVKVTVAERQIQLDKRRQNWQRRFFQSGHMG